MQVEQMALRYWALTPPLHFRGGGEMGQTETWPNIGPITMNLDETKWDRIPPMSRTFLGGVLWPSGAKLCDFEGGGAPKATFFPRNAGHRITGARATTRSAEWPPSRVGSVHQKSYQLFGEPPGQLQLARVARALPQHCPGEGAPLPDHHRAPM